MKIEIFSFIGVFIGATYLWSFYVSIIVAFFVSWLVGENYDNGKNVVLFEK